MVYFVADGCEVLTCNTVAQNAQCDYNHYREKFPEDNIYLYSLDIRELPEHPQERFLYERSY